MHCVGEWTLLDAGLPVRTHCHRRDRHSVDDFTLISHKVGEAKSVRARETHHGMVQFFISTELSPQISGHRRRGLVPVQ